MEKNYDHKKYEQEIYRKWETSGAFAPSPISASATKGRTLEGPTFSIIMPPPNANDPLHVGHAMFVSIEDILIRYHRMKGEAVLWLPGTDHAGIETQFVYEKKLAKQDKSRFDFDRETLYKMIWDYVQENSNTAIDQIKKLGASADWTRFKFTLDPDIVSQVLDCFQTLYKDKLIYRGERLVHYCTKCGTGYSELEVHYIEETTKLYYIKYGPFVLATTRPETKFADTAVAVHPNDKRYAKYVGKNIEVNGLLGTFKLNVIADEFVDPKFGTGVVKITPYHDFDDYEAWQRHKDEMPEPKQVIGLDGKLTGIAGKYAGMKIKPARELIEKDLKEKGLLAKAPETYVHNIGTCYRCGTILEPLPMPQFFVSVKPLAEKALNALDKKETIVLGAGREKILRNWLTNLKDWNISRQIVWGIRIPVWYDTEQNPDVVVGFLNQENKFIQGKIGDMQKNYQFSDIERGLQFLRAGKEIPFTVSVEKPGEHYLQETDSFDTWFSSGQWPVVTLKATKPGDFERFYPTSVMETGYDILPFWVMRMMLLGIYLTGKSPFKTVYLHGLIRDEQGRKMSKSIGNVINPLDMVTKYGADALRMALVMGSTPGQDKNVGEQTIRGMRNLSNKIWNAARYVIASKEASQGQSLQGLSLLEEEFMKKLQTIVGNTTKQLEDYRIGLAAEMVYSKFWHWFCDECIERSKAGEISHVILQEGLETFLKLLHPFMPFVTEAVWAELGYKDLLISAPWPKPVNHEQTSI